MRKMKLLDGVKIGGYSINIRYADDNAIIADSKQLQSLINELVKESRKYGSEINKSKTVSMTISKKSQNPKCKIMICVNKSCAKTNMQLGILITKLNFDL